MPDVARDGQEILEGIRQHEKYRQVRRAIRRGIRVIFFDLGSSVLKGGD
jgi:hypothetical protein